MSKDGNGPPQKAFGSGLAYLWGNVPAVDSLNISQNETDAAVAHDFNLCFAGTDDPKSNLIRNIAWLT